MRALASLSSAVLVLAWMNPQALAGSVTVQQTEFDYFISDQDGVQFDFVVNSIPPFDGTFSDSTPLGSSVSGELSFSEVGGVFSIVGSGAQTRLGLPNDYVQQFSIIKFTVNQPATYSFEGSSSLAGANFVQISAYLDDDTAANGLFATELDSNTTPNEVLTFGEAGGDLFNSLTGSLSGNLLAGHQYTLLWGQQIGQYFESADDGGASLNGSFRFTVTPLTEIPEPSSFLLFTLGSCVSGLGLLRKRRCRTRVHAQ